MSIDPFEGAIPSGDSTEKVIESKQEVQYAGFWIRFLASVIDSFLVLLIIAPIIDIFYGEKSAVTTSFFDSSGFSSYNFESMSTLTDTGQVAYFVLVLAVVMLFWIYRSATPGKMLLRLKIVDATSGGHISKRQGLFRYFGYYVSTVFFLLGFIWAGFDPRKQAWHDKMAGTLVIHTNKAEKNPE